MIIRIYFTGKLFSARSSPRLGLEHDLEPISSIIHRHFCGQDLQDGTQTPGRVPDSRDMKNLDERRRPGTIKNIIRTFCYFLLTKIVKKRNIPSLVVRAVGAHKDMNSSKCQRCDGIGMSVRAVQTRMYRCGFVNVAETCPICLGTGRSMPVSLVDNKMAAAGGVD
jgi:hypothetical protein